MYQTGTNALQIPDQSIPDKFHLLIVLEACISMKSLVTFIIIIQRHAITGVSIANLATEENFWVENKIPWMLEYAGY